MLLSAAGSRLPQVLQHCPLRAAGLRCSRRLIHAAAAHGAAQWAALGKSIVSSRGVVQQADGENLTCPTDLQAIMVLGGGLTEAGELPAAVERRLQVALAMLRQQQRQQTCCIVCLGGGTPHKPPVLERGYVLHEATCCSDWLLKHGVPAGQLLKEISSYDTVGNGFFALTTHALPAGWRRIAVITSAFHMPRTRAIFEQMWRMGASESQHASDEHALWFAEASDDGLLAEDVHAARCAKEAAALATWQADAQKLRTLADLHAWLHATHRCYAVARQHEANQSTIQGPLLASY